MVVEVYVIMMSANFIVHERRQAVSNHYYDLTVYCQIDVSRITSRPTNNRPHRYIMWNRVGRLATGWCGYHYRVGLLTAMTPLKLWYDYMIMQLLNDGVLCAI